METSLGDICWEGMKSTSELHLLLNWAGFAIEFLSFHELTVSAANDNINTTHILYYMNSWLKEISTNSFVKILWLLPKLSI